MSVTMTTSCSVPQHLKTVQRSCQSVLGTMQIMVGLLSIGFGFVFHVGRTRCCREFHSFPIRLGALFIVFGITCILSERFSSPCLVRFNIILNLAGVGFAIAAIVLHSIGITNIEVWNVCYHYNDYHYHGGGEPWTPQEIYNKQKCLESTDLQEMLLMSVNAVLIILSVLELCVTISSVALGIKALKSPEKEPEKDGNNVEDKQQELEEGSVMISHDDQTTHEEEAH